MHGAPQFQRLHAKQVMNRVTAPSMPFSWSLNPYRGCTHGCSFCYARTTHTYIGLSADDTFRNHIFVKEDAATVLEGQLSRKLRKFGGNLLRLQEDIGLLAIGTATDPYQPIEARAKITRACLEVLADYQIPTSITTRSPLILRDVDVLLRMNLHSINFSINTLDKNIWRGLEPATPAPLKRLEAVQSLFQAGLSVGVFLAPILPSLTDSFQSLEEVVSAAKQHQAQYLMPSVLRLTPEVRTWFFAALEHRFPSLLPTYRRLYRTAYPPLAYVKPVMSRVRQLMSQTNFPSYSELESSFSTHRHSPNSMEGEQMVLPL